MVEKSPTEKLQDPELLALRDLEHKIDLTRRSRMEASDRLISFERFIQAINIYYSCFAVIISILSLFENKIILSLISAILTSILAISIVYLNAQRFGSRSQQFRDNFLDFYQLQFRVNAAIRSSDFTKTQEFETEYINLLRSVENHSQQDFFRILSLQDRIRKRRNGNYEMQFTGLRRIQFCCSIVFLCILKLIIWVIPILFTAVSIYILSMPQ